MKPSKSLKKSFGGLDAEATAGLVAAASDIAIVIDKKGIIRDFACDSGVISGASPEEWIGKPWQDTVTIESRPKVEAMLAEASSGVPARSRQVNHPIPGGVDLPVRYSAVPLGAEGRLIALGRDLSTISELQQRIVRSEQQVERELARARAIETRYRALFHLATEAVLIVDLGSLKVVEGNPTAIDMFTNGSRRVVGRQLLDLVHTQDRAAVDALVAAVRGSPRVDDIEVRLAQSNHPIRLAISLFRQDGVGFLLVRLARVGREAGGAAAGGRSVALGVLEHLPDGIVVCDAERKVLLANAAFLELVELAAEEQVRGEPVDRWIGRVDVDVDILFASLREHGAVRRFSTAVRGEYGNTQNVEISGVFVNQGPTPCIGLSIRPMPREPLGLVAKGQAVPRSIEQLTELVGRVPLKELVRETTDIIERMCIEAALELTGDNRASAAEMLGLSRQSLYVKLRRYGLGELDSDIG